MYGDGGAWFTAPITSGYVQRGGYGSTRTGSRTGWRPSAQTIARANRRDAATLRVTIRALTRQAVARGASVPVWSEPSELRGARLVAALQARVDQLQSILRGSRGTGQTAAEFVAAQADAPQDLDLPAALVTAEAPAATGRAWVVPTVVGVVTVSALGAAAFMFWRSR
jgi:hypothetical protein